ncbi:MAG TPA: hypothetical protein VI895_12730 [Bdellovibrionota bacterium]|nr:hypothetical protein [Bdellovibrionota bacterium]
MSEEDKIVCSKCEKIIRYERPLFCPYCGAKLEPVEDLLNSDDRREVYRWSHAAPLLMNLFFGWLLLLLPASWIWGKAGIFWLSILFTGILIVAFVGFLVFSGMGAKKRS